MGDMEADKVALRGRRRHATALAFARQSFPGRCLQSHKQSYKEFGRSSFSPKGECLSRHVPPSTWKKTEAVNGGVGDFTDRKPSRKKSPPGKDFMMNCENTAVLKCTV